MIKFGNDCASPDQAQRIAEGQNLGIRADYLTAVADLRADARGLRRMIQRV